MPGSPAAVRHDPVFEDARLEPLLDQADDAWVADPVLDEADQPISTDFIEERSDIGVQYEVHFLAGDPNREREHVEVDETWIGGRTRGEGRGVHHKVLVACAVEVRHRKPGTARDKRNDGRYAGRVRLAVAADRSAKSLCGFVDGAVAPATLIVTDDWSGYADLRKRGYDHHAIAECGDSEVTDEFLPIIHLVFANLKTWLTGIHHGVSERHLQAYLNEFTFRFNRRFYPFNAFRSLLGIASDAKAPTYAQLYSGDWNHPTSSGCMR